MPKGYCVVRACLTKEGEGKALFSFPKNLDSAKVWADACHRTDILNKKCVTNFKLCELHFEETWFSKTGVSRKRLLPNAVPTVFDHIKKRPVEKETSDVTSKKIKILSDVPVVLSKDTNMKPLTTFPISDEFQGPSCSKEIEIEPLCISADLSSDMGSSSCLLSPTTSTQTLFTLSAHTPRKEKLRRKIKILEERRASKRSHQTKEGLSIEDFNNMCDNFLDKTFAALVKSHAVLRMKKPLARRYSNEIKQSALALYFLSPKAYRHLSRLMTLPDKRTLERLTQNLSCQPGLDNTNIFKALELKLKTMIEQEKHCMLCIDEMSIKSNLFYDTGRDEIIGFENTGRKKSGQQICKNVLVIMARGLYSHWKQPVAYFFIGTQFKATELRPILEECIVKLRGVGLKVEGISSDMGSNFVELARSFGVTPENSEFEIADQKLFYIFDPCHLIKATRNNLLKHSFSFKDKKTSWSHIQSFYEKDKKNFYRCAPKLTDAHLNPSSFDKMKVSFAAQVFSHSVVVGMSTHITLGSLPNEAFGTIEVLELFNNLFDICNSFSLAENQKYKKVFEGSEEQVKFLKDALQFLNEVQIFNKNGQNLTNRVKFNKCWSITINSLLKLWEKLSKSDFKYLKTRRLNTDCLENFFGSVRQQGGNCINPTPIQFQRAFRKLFFQNFYSQSMNCKMDLDEILVDMKSTKVAFLSEEKVKCQKALILYDYDYRKQDIPANNAFTYVCGYLLKKVLTVHSCDTCTDFARECQNLDADNILIHFKAYDYSKGIFGGLLSPPKDFINYICRLEDIFNSNFEKNCARKQISHYLFTLMEKIDFIHPCTDFPRLYLVKLFIRMKIFYNIKYNNRDLKSCNKKAERKLKILLHK